MPKEFNDCVKNGGRVRTKQLKGGKYIKVCYDKEGNSYSGEVMKTKHKKKSKGNKGRYDNPKKLVNSLRKLKEYFDENYRN